MSDADASSHGPCSSTPHRAVPLTELPAASRGLHPVTPPFTPRSWRVDVHAHSGASSSRLKTASKPWRYSGAACVHRARKHNTHNIHKRITALTKAQREV